MKILKWVLFFLIAFIISFILLRTFSQDVFKQEASAIIIGYTSPQIPIYYYVAGSLIVGFCIGLAAVINNFITSTAGSFKKSKKIKELEKEIDLLREQQANMKTPVEAPPQREESVEEPQNKFFHKEEKPEKEDEKETSNKEDIDSFLG